MVGWLVDIVIIHFAYYDYLLLIIKSTFDLYLIIWLLPIVKTLIYTNIYKYNHIIVIVTRGENQLYLDLHNVMTIGKEGSCSMYITYRQC